MYKKLYLKLFNETTDTIEKIEEIISIKDEDLKQITLEKLVENLKNTQLECEEIFIQGE